MKPLRFFLVQEKVKEAQGAVSWCCLASCVLFAASLLPSASNLKLLLKEKNLIDFIQQVIDLAASLLLSGKELPELLLFLIKFFPLLQIDPMRLYFLNYMKNSHCGNQVHIALWLWIWAHEEKYFNHIDSCLAFLYQTLLHGKCLITVLTSLISCITICSTHLRRN